MEKKGHCNRKISNAGFSILCLLALPFRARLASAQALATTQPSGTSQQVSRHVATDDQEPLLLVTEGRLTLKVKNRPLGWVLDQLTQKAKIAIVVGKGAGSELLTLDLQDTPLDEALRQMLRHQDAFFFYGPEKEKQDFAVLQVVWVYAKGKGQGLQPVSPEDWASTKDLEAAVADKDPERRLNAIAGVIERSSKDRAMEVALNAITSDKDENVRAMALFSASNKGLKLPTSLLVNLLSSDSSESVRFLALDAVARDPGARSYAEMALKDPSPHVQQKAHEILNQLEAAESRRMGETPAPTQQPQNRVP